MQATYTIPKLPLPCELETKEILKQLAKSHRYLAELKGVSQSIPNKEILISSLSLQEAKDSSAIENIVTTDDELYKTSLEFDKKNIPSSAKEVLLYREAIKSAFYEVKNSKLLTNKTIIKTQEMLERNNAGFRTQSGTYLKDGSGNIIYTPPQDILIIQDAMKNLEQFINDDEMSDIDPLIKMAIIHHQFESIHPFYDGNGRTGRIICILYLVLAELLELPILYLSRYIIKNKNRYYKLLQEIRNCTTQKESEQKWQEWILFMLKGVEETAIQSVKLVNGINSLMAEYKIILRQLFGKQYRHEILNNLFFHPYTKISFMEKDMDVSRITAMAYLNKIMKHTDLLNKMKIGKENYYINTKLFNLFYTHNSQ